VRGGAGLAALAVSLVVYGCAGDGPPPAGDGGAFDQIQTEIFNQNCLSAGCHNGAAQAGGLNLSEGVSYDDLVDVLSENAVAADRGLLRVEPFEPDDSFLIIKLTNPALGEGTRMPQGANPLPASDIEMIRAWIADGAPRGGTPVPSATNSTTPSATPTPTAGATASVTPTPPNTATPTVTITGTAPPSATPTLTPTVSPTPSASPSPTLEPWLVRIQEQIFTPSCATMFCHDAATASGDLVLTDEAVSYADLVGVEPDNRVARDRGLLRVVPNQPLQSFLIVKVTNPPLGEGSRMPLIGAPLTVEQIALLVGWIEAGAPED
jgi:hypothetical protein